MRDCFESTSFKYSLYFATLIPNMGCHSSVPIVTALHEVQAREKWVRENTQEDEPEEANVKEMHDRETNPDNRGNCV